MLCLAVGIAEAQQRGVVVRGGDGMAGVIVGGGGVGSAVVSGRDDLQGIVVDSRGRVQRYRQGAAAGGAIGAFAGGGSGGIVTGSFDPFDFVFGQHGFPDPRFAIPGPMTDVIELDTIEAAFRRGDFALALQKSEEAARSLPGDPEIQQLQALSLFALGRHTEAGQVVRDVLDGGLIWDWATLRRHYDSNASYLAHLRALQNAAGSQPGSADTMILLAYHDLVLGRLDAAREAAQAALGLRPDDGIARDLLASLPPDLDESAER
jgi:hypothetical protein